MIGSLLTRALVLVLGYAYPAYECFKVVELNRPEIEQLRFWCQYWILVALLTVFERVGDTFVSWIPMYSEAKLAFFVYLWYPKTKGTTYVYDTFFRPYIAQHEPEIDRNLLELRTKAGDFAVLYFQKAASYGQTRFLDILQYVASQSPSQSTRSHPAQRPQPQQVRQARSVGVSGRQPAASNQPQPQPQQPVPVPPSPTKSQLQETAKGAVPTRTVPAAAQPQPQPQASSGGTGASTSENASVASQSEGEAMQVDMVGAPPENSNPPPQETLMEEAIRMTRGRLRKQIAGGAVGLGRPSTR